MAKPQFRILISLLFLALAFTSINAYKKVEIFVEGMVYCQSCKCNGTQSLTDAEPIPAGKVSVTCTDHEDKVSLNKTFEANADGYYYALLDGFKISHYFLDHPLHSCKVKLVSSPLTECNISTNVNYGTNGASLHYENKKIWTKNFAAVIYAASPVAFRPANCSTN